MKLLILGGTIFLGRHVVEAALARGHEVTLFNRGQHNADLFPQVEKLRGDRDGGLVALKGRQWDAVVDTCGYVPRLVRDSAQLLADDVEHYTFISSISVYDMEGQKSISEGSPLATMEDETVEEVDGTTYGPLKVLCEQAAEAAMPGRVHNVRAGLIVGPRDPTDRFTYWPHRVARGGEILTPDARQQPVQFIHVRDLAEWILHAAEKRIAGSFNATGPNPPLSFELFLEQCRETVQSDGRFVWVDEHFLAANEVAPWSDLPLWLPNEMHAMLNVDCGQAVARGLETRPIAETIADTLRWSQSREDHEWRAGLAPEREAELLRLFSEKSA